MTTENRAIPVRRAAGFSVHVFTASGGAVALLALYAAIERNFPACFAWLGLALFIDGIDGTLARAARVTETAATIDGAILDLVVDFLTYVLVPVVALWRSDLMPTLGGLLDGAHRHHRLGALFRRHAHEDRGSLVSRLSRAVERLRALSLRLARALAGERRADARRRRR